jgi:hypothetical protein
MGKDSPYQYLNIHKFYLTQTADFIVKICKLPQILQMSESLQKFKKSASRYFSPYALWLLTWTTDNFLSVDLSTH